jgi:outer membrane protein assembly factor BamB/tetratricopeptide (TPR) repeat protein
MRHLPRLVAIVSCLGGGALADGAEFSWSGSDRDQPPPGWEFHRAPGSQAAVRWERGDVVLRAESWHFAHLDHTLAGMEGSDERPLRAQCAIAAEDAAIAGGRPTLMALCWASGAIIAVGVGDGGGTSKPVSAGSRRAWVMTVLDGKIDSRPLGASLYPGAVPGHVRVVVTTRDVSAFASRDGWAWERVASFPRVGALAAAPERIVLGRGWPGDSGSPLDHDDAAGAADLAESRITRVMVSDAPPGVSAELLKSYVKKETLEDTTDAITASGSIRQWRIVGPFAPGPKRFGPEDGADPATPFEVIGGTAGWKPFTPGEAPTDRIISLGDLLPRPGADLARFAQTTIVADSPRTERFLFDGTRDVALFLNGRELARDRHDNGEVIFDRLSVTGELRQGENQLVVETLSTANGRAAFTLRHESGEAMYRIALLRRLAADFAGETEYVISAQREIARLWEDLGYTLAAADALDDLVKNPDANRDQVDAALIDRARLHLELRDDVRVAADVDELITRWSGPGEDRLAGQLKAAQLWDRMRQPARADTAFAQAEAAAGDDAEQQIEVSFARARVHTARGDLSAVGADLRTAAKRLNKQDPRKAELLVAALANDLRLGSNSDSTLDGFNFALASPEVLRVLTAICARRGDRAHRLAALDALAGVAGPAPLDAAEVAAAECLLAAQGDPAQPIARYRKAIAALPSRQEATSRLAPGKDGVPTIGALRAAYVYASLAETADGRALLDEVNHLSAEAKGARSLPGELRGYAVCGPIDNAGWRCYDPKVLVQLIDPTHVDTTKPIEGRAWQVPDASAWSEGYLDLYSLYHAENCCGFAYAEFDSDLAVDSELSMGADDGLVLWFNGEKLHEDREQRGLTPDSIGVKVRLKKGRNTLLAMIQQGGGAWAFQVRLKGGSLIGDVAAALRRLDEHPDARAESAAALAAMVDSLMRADRYGQAVAVGRTVLRAFPDQPAAQLTLALHLIDHAGSHEEPAPLPTLLMNNGAWKLEPAKARGDVTTLEEVAAWLDGSPEALAPEHEAQVRDARYQIGSQLGERMRLEGALAAFGSLMRSGFDVGSQVRALYGLGELYRRCGYPRLATAEYARALALDPDMSWSGALHNALRLSRETRGEKPPFDLAPDVDAALAAADRAVAAGDVQRAVAAYQKVLEDSAGQLCHDADGGVASVATVCAQRLSASGEAGIAAYRDLAEGSARTQLERAEAEGSADACERVALAYPHTAAAATALERAADRYLDAGQWALAEGTIRNRLGDQTVSAERRGTLQAQAKRASAGARVASTSAPIVDPALGPGTQLAAFAVAPVDRRDAARFSGDVELRAVCSPMIAGEVAYLATLDDCFALDLGSGARRWSALGDQEALLQPRRSSSFMGFPEHQAAVVDGLVVSRIIRGGTAVIEAREAATGALAWSSETLPQLAGLSASSSPSAGDGRVYATFVDQGRVALAAFLVADGRLLWLTPLSSRRAPVPVQGAFDAIADGHAAPPACAGRDVYVASDLGTVMCIDAGNGAVRWTASYPRAVLGLTDGLAMLPLLQRAPTRVVVDGERLYLAPHDHLGVLAFERSTGSTAWRRELCDCRQLVGTTADGRLLVQGSAVELLDPATGQRLWRWVPPADEGPTLGTAAIGSASAYVATARGLHRLSLATGCSEEHHSWTELGVEGASAADLHIARGALIVTTADGRMFRIGGGAAAHIAASGSGKPGFVTIAADEQPATPPGNPLALAWRLVGEPVVEIGRPPAWPADECLVRFPRSLARIDVAKHRILWRVPLVADARECLCGRDVLVVVNRSFVTALDPSNGRTLWMHDVSGHFLLALNESLEGPGVSLCDEAVLSWRAEDLLALDPRTGARIGGCRVDGAILEATVRGGHVFTAERLNDRVIVGERGLGHLATVVARHETQKASDIDGALLIGDGLVVHGTGGSTRFDLMAKTTAALGFPFVRGEATQEDGRLVLTGMNRYGAWVSAVLDASGGQVLAKDSLPDGEGWEQRYALREHVWKDRLVRIERDRQGRNGIAARSLADGTELWYVPGAPWSELAYRELALADGVAVALLTRSDGRFGYQVISLSDGKVLANGEAPGWPKDGATPMAIVSGRVLYGTQQGLFALAPAGAAPPLEADVPISVPPAPGRMAIDAHLDDWQGVPAIALAGGRQGRSAELRVSADGDNLYVAAHVIAPRHRDAAPGAGVLTGDCLLIGIDPLDEHAPGASTPMVFALALVDGRPQATKLSGRLAVGADGLPAGQPTLRVAADATGLVYELALPWPALRGNSGQRPGERRELRLGAAAILHDADGSSEQLELGSGLVDGIEPARWRRLLIGGPSPSKAAP